MTDDKVINLPQRVRPLTRQKHQPVTLMELLERMGSVITEVADGLEDEGDRVYLGSTNHADALADLRQDWFELRCCNDSLDVIDETVFDCEITDDV